MENWENMAYSARLLPPAAERETVVRERLYNLLSTLGELPAGDEEGWGRPGAFSMALETLCPPGHMVLHGCRAGASNLRIDDLVVGRSGLVVVGRSDAPAAPRAGFSQRGASWRARGPVGPGPSGARRGLGPVRETLRRAFALRAWTRVSEWADVPVLAAVCTPPAQVVDGQVKVGSERPALLLDGLWVGPMAQLRPLLASAWRLDGAACAELALFLASGLQDS